MDDREATPRSLVCAELSVGSNKVKLLTVDVDAPDPVTSRVGQTWDPIDKGEHIRLPTSQGQAKRNPPGGLFQKMWGSSKDYDAWYVVFGCL
jgi:hypothetical protein